jgi:asparagine synthase (glutamine-hydrolysing)
MCGIAGIISNKYDSEYLNDVVVKMGQAIKHRGPDATGVYKDQNIALIHQRLSIIDVSEGANQPFYSENKRYVIIFNGEIYNYDEFKDELRNKGYQLKSNSDTEILLYLYMEYGAKMLDRLNGMFAFAIWDTELKELFIGRDRMGVKPLYYYHSIDSFSFASEPKSIFASGAKKEIDENAIYEWLTLRFVAGEKTLFKGIKRLLPGHYMQIKNDNTISIKRWYHLGEKIINHKNIDHPISWFSDTFHSSVKYRMVSDVPVGILLSGGLDSSSVAASTKYNGFDHIHTFNIGFKNKTHDESKIARKFNDSLGYIFHTIQLSGNDLHEKLIKSIIHLDEPLAHMNDPHIMAISEYANRKVKVLLSGEGADELLGGYVRYKTFKYLGFKNQIKNFLSILPDKYKNNRLKKLERYFNENGIDNLIFKNASNTFAYDYKELNLVDEIIENDYRSNLFKEAQKIYPQNPMRQLLYYDQHTYLQSLNDRNDRATMASSIECREPFQDYRLVEGLGTLDINMLTRGKKSKFILKESMSELLPDYIKNFKKIGLSVPWIEQIKESTLLIQEWEEFKKRKSFGIEFLDKLNLAPNIEKIDKGYECDHQSIVLQIFMIHLWMKYYFQ